MSEERINALASLLLLTVAIGFGVAMLVVCGPFATLLGVLTALFYGGAVHASAKINKRA